MTRDMVARRPADRLLTVLVDDHVEAIDEPVAIVKVERPAVTPLVIEKLVRVVPTLQVTGLAWLPHFAQLEDRPRRLVSVREEAAQFERQ